MAEAKPLLQMLSAKLGNQVPISFLCLYWSLALLSVGRRISWSLYELRLTPPMHPFSSHDYLKSKVCKTTQMLCLPLDNCIPFCSIYLCLEFFFLSFSLYILTEEITSVFVSLNCQCLLPTILIISSQMWNVLMTRIQKICWCLWLPWHQL